MAAFFEDSGRISIYVAIAIGALSAGYLAGSTTARPRERKSPSTSSTAVPPRAENTGAADDSDDESEASSGDEDTDVSKLELLPSDECKLVLVVRTDLQMSTGKIAAQCSHATLAVYKTLLSSNPAFLRQWERSGQSKVALRCSSEDELLLMQAQAQSLNLCARSIQDAGRTQIAAGSRTVLGIAGPARLVNQITGKLRLL
ncbi:hypothetical protein D9758_002349 [Tetrapyrgos nigripes]|uniref:peptidyl-tRNA hydrolase n=1 Tax=Tetrapyrgos nigripes TaxID=182062 RepID=A0A8H5GP58_9AGAR|nr:hypothetical protein D9758_002349 [Tetrapyrgos nigripes]